MMPHPLVDVVVRPAVRWFRLNGSRGPIEWDHPGNVVRLYRADGDTWKIFDLGSGTVAEGHIHPKEPNVAGMPDFLAATRGEGLFPTNYEQDERVPEILRRAEASASSGLSQ